MEDVSHIEAEIARLERDQEKLRARHEANRVALARLRARLRQVTHRAALTPLLGTDGGVRYDGPDRRLRGRVGTLTDLHRTRCSVTFDGESWKVPAGDVIPADAEPSRWIDLATT